MLGPFVRDIVKDTWATLWRRKKLAIDNNNENHSKTAFIEWKKKYPANVDQ